MPLFSKSYSGLTPNANVVLHWRPYWDTAGNHLQYSNETVSSSGTYTASFSYDYDEAYAWSLYYGQYGSATTLIDSGTTTVVPSYYVNGVAFEYSMAGLGSTYEDVQIGETETMNCHLYITNPNNIDFTPNYTVHNSNSSVMSCSYSLNKTSASVYNVVLSITGKSAGSSIVTVSSNGYSASLTFIIKSTSTDPEPDDPSTPTPSMTINSVTIQGSSTHNLNIGVTNQFSYIINVSNNNGVYPTVNISTSPEGIVSYSNTTTGQLTGTIDVTALKVGTTILTVKVGSKTDSITINVTDPTVEPEEPEIPEEVKIPLIEKWIITESSISAKVKNLNAGEVVTLQVGSFIQTTTAITTDSIWITVEGLKAETAYDVILSTDINNLIYTGQITTQKRQDITTLFPELKEWIITATTIKIPVRNLIENEQLTLTVGDNISQLTCLENGYGLDMQTIDLTPNTIYEVTLTSNINGTLFSGTKKTSSVDIESKGSYIGIPKYQDFLNNYSILEYIEVTGTQYINTNFIPNNNSGIELVFALDANNLTSNNIIGSRNTTTEQAFSFSTTNSCWRFGYNNSSTATTITADANKHTVIIDKNICRLDNVDIDSRTNSEFSGYNSIFIGRINASSSTYKGYGKIYSCKIYDNEILVRDYIPCKSLDGITGMYDLVEKKFYTNAGTGTFVAGPVVCYEATQLDYITINGNQYIDTGIIPNNNSRVVIDFENTGDYSQVTTSAKVAPLFGGRTDTGVSVFGMWFGVEKVYPHFGNKSYSGNGSIDLDINRRLVYDLNKNILTVDNQSKTCTTATFTSAVSLYLFAMNTNGKLYANKPSGKFYSCQIYDNDILVRDYIPCKINNGKIGLLDKISGFFFESIGTEQFIAGNVVPNIEKLGNKNEIDINIFNNDTKSVARKIKKQYIGAITEVPKYETQMVETKIKGNNIKDFFNVSYGQFPWSDEDNNGSFFTRNDGVHDSQARIVLEAQCDMDVSFDYYYSTEASCDIFRLTVKNIVALELSGIGNGTRNETLKKGQSIIFLYEKDYSANANGDVCSFSNMTVKCEQEVQTGTVNKDVARKIKKAYIGIDGVARLIYLDDN